LLKTRTYALAASLALVAFGGGASAPNIQPIVALDYKAQSFADGQFTGICILAPHLCGFPDRTTTGVPPGTALESVPDQVSSGPGWYYDPRGWVEVTGNGAVLSGLYIPYNVDISASDVTLEDDDIVTDGPFGVSLRNTSGATIENSTVRGQDSGDGRVDAAISDVYGDSTGTVVMGDNISDFRIAVQLENGGLVEGNYIHHPGYIDGDHTDGIMAGGSTVPTTIEDNTVFINLGQTDAISLNASGPGQEVANQTVEDNLIAGGAYSIYCGAGNDDPTSNIVIENNRFGQQYFSQIGQYGPDADFDPTGPGNIWSGNIGDITGDAIAY
jgi:hypothetical protein